MKKFGYDVCIYHGGCPDGIGGAFPFWLEAKKSDRLGEMLFIGGIHGIVPEINKIKGKHVLFVDFSYKRATIIDLCKHAESMLILDHHDTAKRDLEGLDLENLTCIIDTSRSGAQIAWDYVYDKPRPWFIEIIADRDLWKWEIPNSKEIGAALYTLGWYRWEKMEELCESKESNVSLDSFLEKGKFLAKLNDMKIQKSIRKGFIREFLGYKVMMVTGDAELRSEIGGIAASQEDVDFAAFYRHSEQDGQVWISLRGSEECEIVLNKLCEKYGGGGHPKAAGFAIHTIYSETWQNADSIKRQKLAHGTISDYFVRMEQ